MTIVQKQTTENEIVLSERVVTNEYRIVRIEESIEDRRVEVAVEIGPFVEEQRGDQTVTVAKGGRRRVTVWENEAYEAIRDTWKNEDLLSEVATKM